MNIVIGGHVDHGKSTIIGRLLADTRSLPEGKLDQIRALCARTSKPFEYAFLLDALKDERAQGITIDASRVFFKSAARDYIIIDAPGHVEFLKNLITGAARAEAALLVIDAREGVRENSRRHGYMMSMLGVNQVAVLVNKMDLVGCDEAAFRRLDEEYREFLAQVGIQPTAVIPVVGRDGDNIATASTAMSWYRGPTVLDVLDTFASVGAAVDRPFRMPVQDVYKFTSRGDDRRIVAGTIEAGSAAPGDVVVFYPSGKKSTIKTIEAFNRAQPARMEAGEAVGFTLAEQIYVARGELAALADQPRPSLTSRFRATVFWLGREPLRRGRDYAIKIGSARAAMRLDSIERVIDASTLAAVDAADAVNRHEVAECTVSCNRTIAFDRVADQPTTGRFVIVDGYDVSGGGVIRDAIADTQTPVRERVLLREFKWEPSFIAPERRAGRFAQRPTLLLVTGHKDTDRKTLAKHLEARLFDEGRVVYFLGMGNVLYGVDADLSRDATHRREHVRRLAEIANLMLDAGVILIASAQALTSAELDIVRTTVDPSRVQTVWVGPTNDDDPQADLVLPEDAPADEQVKEIRTLLVRSGVLFDPWLQ